MLENQQKNKKEKKVHAVFYQVGFILILYWENNRNYNKGRSPSNGKLSDFSFYIDS
jgi:hypothetical protein